MNCPICEHSNPDDNRFCGDCGAVLDPACPSCGQRNPANNRFCGACGTSLESDTGRPTGRQPSNYTPKHLAEKILQSRSALEGERKQLTVLFADVKGSMELAEQVDPEEWHRILDRFFRILTEGVHRFEGTVNQYTGDGIMALFGAPIAHEDHAQRACYAALHIAEKLRAYADELRLETGLSFAARIGINSGEAVVGRIGDDLRMDYTAQGQTVGLAQRMEQLAEPGRCYLTDQTARLVEGYFNMRRLGETRVKGVTDPIGVHELESVGTIRTRFDVSRSRGLSSFVGRGDEMGQLETAVEESVAGKGRVVMVVGDAGVGKSRLCFEFAERCRARDIRVTEAQAVAHGASLPLLPVLQLLRSAFEIAEDDRDEVVRRKVAGALLLLDPAFQGDLGLIFDLLGVPDPTRPAPDLDAQVRERKLREIVCRIFRLWGGSEPAVLLLEDLHWMDVASEAILDDIAREAGQTSKLLLLNYRPDFEPHWNSDTSVTSHSISLAPLGPEEVRRLLEEHVGNDPSASELLDQVEQQTGGNPFYIEEVVRSLVEANALVGSPGAYRLEKPVAEISVPPTVQATIAGRIDRLEESDKSTLHAAAVIGRRFRGDLLREISELDGDQVDSSLQELVDRHLIDLEALYPEREYAFRHALTRDVAYASPLSEFRARTHRAVARAVERRKAEQVDEVAGLIAFHLEAAEDDLEAAVWHARAGRHVRGTRVFRTAVHHWRSVRHLLAKAEATEETTDLLIEAGIAEIELSLLVGQPREEVEAVLHDTRAAARSAGKVHSEIALLTAYNRYLIGVNAAREAVAALEEAAALASRAGDPNLLVSALTALGLARQSVGSILTAGKAIDDCFAIIKTSGADLDPSVRQSAFAMGTIVLMYAGRLDDAEEALRRAAREIEEYELPLRTYYFASFLADRRGRPEAALKLARTAVEYAEPDGAPFELVLSNNAMGQALWAVGRFREAANHWRRSLEIGRSQGVMMNVQPLQLGGLASTHIGLGELEEARRFAVEAIRIAVDAGVGTMECAARIVMLRVLAAEGAADEMEAEIEQTAILIDRIDGHGYFDPLLSEARAQLAEMRGDRTLRRRELEETARLQEAIGADGHAERIRKLLDD